MNKNKKFVEQWDINDIQILTDEGFVDVKALGKTIPYLVYYIETENGMSLKCADNHIVFDEYFNEVFVKDLEVGNKIHTSEGISQITKVENLECTENMYDFELSSTSKHRYYTNGILSHNTLLAKTLAKEIYCDEKNLVRFDMSEYADKTSINKLIGSSAGYVGYNDGGLLTEAIKTKKHCVLLFDEIEKADEEVFNLFLQIFDEGFLTDNMGQRVDFRDTIIILTSNVGTKIASETRSLGFNKDDSIIKKDIIERELKRKFPPEFINRLDSVVYFNSLTEESLKKIIELELNKLKARIQDAKYDIKWDDATIDYILKVISKEREYGARPIMRAIQENIENRITDIILENDEAMYGHEFNITYNDDKLLIQ